MKPNQGKRRGGKRPAAGGRPNRRYGDGAASLDNLVQDVIADNQPSVEEAVAAEAAAQAGMQADEQAPIVMLVHTLLREAIKRNASDIHFEPFEESLDIRFRIDGALQAIQKLPTKLAPVIVSRLKIMAELDIVERRIPQDGCIRFRSPEGDDADFRVSTLPAVFGEKVVLRVLNKDNLNNDLEKIGIPEAELEILQSQVTRPDGLILVTGPTGSGKTTTLYACLTEVNEPSKSIFTAEDPVEGTLKGITQVQINEAVSLNFSTVLRSLLRQDPDIILVGEIRDRETIDIAIKAALTGHLVLSTLHTNDTAATIQRLLNMGVQPYLISSAVNLIVAQRLVRRICDDCKEPKDTDLETLKKMGLDPEDLKGAQMYHGAGCKECGESGYKGRAPIYEIMQCNEALKEAILKGASTAQLKNLARHHGMITLREAGIELVKQGVTTINEVLGKTNEDEELRDPETISAPAANGSEFAGDVGHSAAGHAIAEQFMSSLGKIFTHKQEEQSPGNTAGTQNSQKQQLSNSGVHKMISNMVGSEGQQ